MEKFDRYIPPILMLLSAALLFPFMRRPLTPDEATSFLMHWPEPWETVFFSLPDQGHHPLVTVLARFFTWVLGESEFAFRLPDIAAGILSAPLVYRLGATLSNSRAAAVMAAFLLVLSTPYLHNDGRGYVITMFLPLAATLAIVQLLNSPDRAWIWEALLVFSGFCLVFTLTSNIYFLAALLLYFFVSAGRECAATGAFASLPRRAISILILSLLVSIYFAIIYPDLKASLKGFQKHLWLEGQKTMEMTSGRMSLLLNYLAAPWGKWLYVFFALGFANTLRRPGGRPLLFAAVFLVPPALSFFSGIMGPPRTYNFWLPFVVLLAASGITAACAALSRLFPGKWAYYLSLTLVAAALSVQPGQKYAAVVAENATIAATTMSDAQQLFTYIKTHTTERDLVVVPFSERVLRHYLDPVVAQNMLTMFQKGRVDRILFITPKGKPPALTYAAPFLADEKSFKTISTFGNLSIYELDGTFAQISDNRPDRENFAVNLLRNPSIKLERVFSPVIEGESALRVRKKPGDDIGVDLLLSTPAGNARFLLLCYARAWNKQRNSFAYITDERFLEPKRTYLNEVAAVFRQNPFGLHWKQISPTYYLVPETDTDFAWQILFALYPVEKNMTTVKELLYVHDETTWWDGFRLFATAGGS